MEQHVVKFCDLKEYYQSCFFLFFKRQKRKLAFHSCIQIFYVKSIQRQKEKKVYGFMVIICHLSFICTLHNPHSAVIYFILFCSLENDNHVRELAGLGRRQDAVGHPSVSFGCCLMELIWSKATESHFTPYRSRSVFL